jgi:hypothetical protein
MATSPSHTRWMIRGMRRPAVEADGSGGATVDIQI